MAARGGRGGGRAGGGGRGGADAYYDEYDGYDRGGDWIRMAVGALASIVLVLGIVVLGVYLFNQVGGDDNPDTVADAAPTEVPEQQVDVYYCAADAQAFRQQVAPVEGAVVGRTIDSRWLAFENPQQPPRQLWIRATDLPSFDTRTVGTVPCAKTPDEFPTPITFTDDALDGGEVDGGEEDEGAEDAGEDEGTDTELTANDGTVTGPTPVPVPTNTPAPQPTPDPNATTPPADPTATPVPDDPTPVPEDPTPVPEDPTPVPEDPTPVPEDPTPVPTEPPLDPDNPRGGGGGDDLGGGGDGL